MRTRSMFDSPLYSIYCPFFMNSFKVMPLYVYSRITFRIHIKSILASELWSTTIRPEFHCINFIIRKLRNYEAVKAKTSSKATVVVFRSYYGIVFAYSSTFFFHVNNNSKYVELALTAVFNINFILLFVLIVFPKINKDCNFSLTNGINVPSECCILDMLSIVMPTIIINFLSKHGTDFLTRLFHQNFSKYLAPFFQLQKPILS